jgi:hypothetical protein
MINYNDGQDVSELYGPDTIIEKCGSVHRWPNREKTWAGLCLGGPVNGKFVYSDGTEDGGEDVLKVYLKSTRKHVPLSRFGFVRLSKFEKA